MNRKCRIKNDKLIPFLNLGKQPLANGFLGRKDKIKKLGSRKNLKWFNYCKFPKKRKFLTKIMLFTLAHPNIWTYILQNFQKK